MRVLAAVLAVAVAGCADTARQGAEQRLSALVGVSEQELVRRMGAPTRVGEEDGQRVVVYYQYWPDFAFFGTRSDDDALQATPGLIDRYCETRFAVAQGRVEGFALRGSACGWGGYPVIAPA